VVEKRLVPRLVSRVKYDTSFQPYIEWSEDPFGGQWVERDVVIKGTTVVLDGWSLDAVISRDAEEGINTVHAQEGVEIETEWFSLDGTRCDHCGHKRFRKSLLVVSHADEGRKIIGTKCLADFLPNYKRNPGTLASYAEYLASFLAEARSGEFDEERAGRVEDRHDPLSVLTLTAAVVRIWGWVPKSSGYEHIPTAIRVADLLSHHGNEARKALDEAGGVVEADGIKAQDALEWVKTLSVAEGSDYIRNIAAVGQKQGWRVKDLGLGCSILTARGRDLEWAAEKARKAAQDETKGLSQHFGTVKERLVITAEITKLRAIEGHYGLTTLVEGFTPEGNVVKWWASGSVDIEIGDTITGKATIKDHDEYQGINQTVVNRWAWELVEVVADKVA
jgi:hypothetical protein